MSKNNSKNEISLIVVKTASQKLERQVFNINISFNYLHFLIKPCFDWCKSF